MGKGTFWQEQPHCYVRSGSEHGHKHDVVSTRMSAAVCEGTEKSERSKGRQCSETTYLYPGVIKVKFTYHFKDCEKTS
jgi:hypothetical protein